jgi:leader peptidase (prepilin peptidase)/N-methyltransferase
VSDVVDLIFNIYFFVLGAAVGSFLNVCIYRLPRSLSIVRPRSMCPGCESKIAFYDNIPILSYLVLLGKCRYCNTRISLRYPLVEGVTGLFALAVFNRYGITFEGMLLFAFVCALVTVTFIDLDHRIIPNVITFPGIAIGFAASFVVDFVTFKDALMGIFVGGGTLFLVASGYYLLTKKEGMGGGDVKLLAMIGAFLGWKGAVFTIFVGSALGTVIGAGVAIKSREGRKAAVPFGPFLSIGALLYLFYGPPIIRWYLGLLSY